jgi:hypothetical protein
MDPLLQQKPPTDQLSQEGFESLVTMPATVLDTPIAPIADREDPRVVQQRRRSRVILLALVPFLIGFALATLFLLRQYAVKHADSGSTITTSPTNSLDQNALPTLDTVQAALEQPDGIKFNGEILLGGGFVIAPSTQPTAPSAGQLYYDVQSDQLRLYDGSTFRNLITGDETQTICYVGANCGFLQASDIGDITLPQPLGTGDSPTFAGLTLSGGLGVASGGTGVTSFTTNGVILGNGTGPLGVSNAPSAGQVLVADAAGKPTFVTITGDISVGSNGTSTLNPNTVGASQLVSTGVGAGTYGDAVNYPVFTVDADGRITSASVLALPGGGAGVGSVNGLTGALTLQGTTNQIGVVSGGTTITLSTPQDIAVTSSPTFNGLTLTSLTLAADTVTDITGTGLQVVGGALQTTLGTSVDLASEVTGTLPIANGGTGANTPQGAINNLSGLTTNGDLLYHNGTNTTRLPRGANGQCLLSDATTILWTTCTGDGGVNTIGAFDGGTANANGATITGTTLFLQSASATFPGLVSTIAQTFAGDKTFSNAVNVSGLATFNGNVTVQTGDTLTFNGDAFTDFTGDGLQDNIGALGVDATVCRTSGNCAGVGGTGDVLQNGNSFTALMTLGTNDNFGLNLETNGTARLTIGNTGAAVFTGSLGVTGLTTLNGDLVIQTGDSFTFNGDAFTDLTGDGLQDSAGALSVDTTVCRTSGNCAGVGGTGDILNNGQPGSVRVGSNNANSTILESNNVDRLTIDSTGLATFSGAVTGTGLMTLNGNLTIQTGDTFTFNSDAFTDLTGTGLLISGGALQASLGTSVDLTSEVNGTLPVANGGTGAVTFTSNGVLYGNGTGPLQATAAGSTGQCLLATTGSAPAWGACTGAGGIASFNLAGSTGTPQTITDGETVTIAAGTNITSTAGATDTVTVAVANNPSFSGLVTANGGLTVETGDTFTFNGDGFTDLTGDGLQLSTGTLAVDTTVCRTSGNCAGIGGVGDILNNGQNGTVRIGSNNANSTILESNNVDRLTIDSTGAATFSGALTVTGLTTLNGDLTVQTGDTFTFNADAFTDLTGTGLQISGGALQTTLGTTVDLASEVTGILPIANGGTAANTPQGAINNLSGLTTNGDLLYHNGTNVTRLARGANGECLLSNATTILWTTCTGDGGVTTVGIIDSQTPSANGAVIAGTSIYLQSASASNPGLVNTGTQTFVGDKTFSGLNSGQFAFTSDLTGGARSVPLLSITQANDASNNATSAGDLLTVTNSDTGSTNQLLELTNAGTGNAINLSAAATALNISSAITGINFAPGSYAGAGIKFNQSTASSLSNYIQLSSNISGALTGLSGSFIGLNNTRTLTSGTIDDANSYFAATRNNTINSAGDTFTVSGTMVGISSNCTQTLGTCTDTSKLLNINQQYANASGTVADIANAGTGVTLNVAASNTSSSAAAAAIGQQGTGAALSVNSAASASGIIFTGLSTTDVTTSSGRALNITTGGAGDISIDSGSTGAIRIGVSSAAETISLGGSGANTINVGGGTATGNTQTINVGAATSTGTALTNVNIGNLDNGGALSLKSGTGNTNLQSAGNITIGVSDTNGTLFVLDTKTDPGDPTGANGGMYYNSNSAKFRCYENSAWKDCDTAGSGITGIGTIDSQAKSANGAVIASGNLVLQTADASNPGLVSTGVQTLAGAKTLTGATTLSVNGAVSTPAEYLSGTWFTGGSATTTKPQFLIQPSAATSTGWNTAGTGLGVNAASGFTGSLADFQLNGTSVMNLGSNGVWYQNSLRTCVTGCFSSEQVESVFDLYLAAHNTGSITLDADTSVIFSGMATDITTSTDENLTIAPNGTGNVTLGTSDTTGTLLVLDTKTGTGDPGSPVNGGMYYNSNAAKFRCYENSTWKDCISSGVTTVGTYGGSITNGMSISGTTITLGAADATNPGGVSTNGQTFGGAKTFNSLITGQAGISTSGGPVTLQGNAASSLTTTTGALTITSAAAATWSTGAGILTLSGNGGLTAGTNTQTGASSAVTILTGNSTTSGNTGAISLTTGQATSGTAGSISLDIGAGTTGTPGINLGTANNYAARTATIGGTTQTGTITVGQSTATNTIAIGNANTATGNTQTINIGAGTPAGTGLTNINIGNLADGGALIFKSGTGNTNLQSAGNITIGVSDTTGTLLVLDTKTGAGDPGSPVNGGMYYNSNAGKFRCYEASAWKDCITSPGGLFTDTGTFAYLTQNTDSMSFGGTTDLGAKLQVVGTSDQEQLLIRAYSGQTNASPLVLFQDSVGGEIARLNVDGSDNVVLGANALSSASLSGQRNIALSNSALQNNTSGSGNFAAGYHALLDNTGGSNSIAIGDGALAHNSSGNDNIALGYLAMVDSDGGQRNIAFGTNALANNTGSSNTALGFHALLDNGSGSNSIAIGDGALVNNSSGSDNIALGFTSMQNSEGGSHNIALGASTLQNNTGSGNSAIGQEALSALASGDGNLGFGWQAGGNLTSGNYGIFIGNGVSAPSSTGDNQLNIADLLTSSDYTSAGLTVNGTLAYTPGTADTNTAVCRNAAGQLAACTSSERFKDNVQELSYGLDQLRLLQPVSYTWNTNGRQDVGFIAEEVAAIIPQAVTYDQNGEVASFNPATITALLTSSLKQLDLQVQSIDQRLRAVENGQLAVLSVSGNASVAGSLTVSGNTTVNKLYVNGHIVGNPDTRGSVTVPANETSLHHDFTSSFDSNPYIVLTPVDDFADYRVETDQTGFTVFLATPPSQPVTFNYMIQQ